MKIERNGNGSRYVRAATAACGALLLIIAPSMACAGWNNTEWGMTDPQIRALYPTATEVSNSLEVQAPIRFAGSIWTKIRFGFDTRGQLRSVDLSGSDAFNELNQRIAGQLGAPVASSSEAVFGDLATTSSATFRDVTKNNLVRLNSLAGKDGSQPPLTTLTYERLPRSGF
jgi:hypothetical protein